MIMYKNKLLLQTFLWKGRYAKICGNSNRNFCWEKGANRGLGLCVSVMGTVANRAPEHLCCL